MRQTIYGHLVADGTTRTRFIDIQIPRGESFRVLSLKCRPEGHGSALVTAQVNRRSWWRGFFTNYATDLTIDEVLPGGVVLRIIQEPWLDANVTMWISLYIDRIKGGA